MERGYSCNGQGVDGDHCCYVGGERCPHLVENEGGRRFACALMIKYGNWDDVVESPEYKPIGDYWARGSSPFDYCRSFDPAFCCRFDMRTSDMTHDEWGRLVMF